MAGRLWKNIKNCPKHIDNQFIFIIFASKMELLKGVLTRRSIRKYSSGDIQPDHVKSILEAAQYAPTARNQQPWHFVYTQSHNDLQALSELHPYGKMLANASLAILVCGDLKKDPTESYLIQNCAAATQNILLAAHSINLGAVWLGVHPREKRMQAMIDFFELPAHIIPISLVSIGYPDELPAHPERFNANLVSKNKYGASSEL